MFDLWITPNAVAALEYALDYSARRSIEVTSNRRVARG